MNELATARHEYQDYLHGIRHNQAQFIYQLLQVLLVGLTLGMMRTVVPALASSEFGVPKGSFMLLIAFVVAFGSTCRRSVSLSGCGTWVPGDRP